MLLRVACENHGWDQDDAARFASRLGDLSVDPAQRASASDVTLLLSGLDPSPCLRRLNSIEAISRSRMIVVEHSRHRAPLDASLLLADAGADDVLVDSDDAIQTIVARVARWKDIDQILDTDLVRKNLLGDSPAWRRVLRLIAEAAHFSAAPVLINGPTGTGKELLARLVHTLDSRPCKGELIVVDCATLSKDLIGSELFGHERGAFTGAASGRRGAIELANSGTLFLDEVGELPLEMQPQLLRALQEGVYKRVGGNDWHRSVFRLVCATNRHLEAEVAAGRFRADLYYRIAGVTCTTPPLDARPSDILPLAQRFLAEALGSAEAPPIAPAVREFLVRRRYSGNCRELRQLCHSIARLYAGIGAISVGCIPPSERTLPGGRDECVSRRFEESIWAALECGANLREIGRIAEDTAVRLALSRAKSTRGAAHLLGVTERAIQLRRSTERTRDRPPADPTLTEPPPGEQSDRGSEGSFAGTGRCDSP